MTLALRKGCLIGLALVTACGLPSGGTLEDDGGGVLADGGLVGVGLGSDAEPTFDAAAGADATTDARGVEAGDSGAPSTGTSSDGGVTASDAGRDGGAGACVPRGAEDCTNGIDDNCDGRVDCADAACTSGYECVPEVPSGWSLVSLAVGSRSPCPSGYGPHRDVVMDPIVPAATCACQCTGTGMPASCTTGFASFYGRSGDKTCEATPTATADVGNGACRNTMPPGIFPSGINDEDPLRISKVALTPNACAASVVRSVPRAETTEGKRCVPQNVALGGGCSAGLVCVRRTSGAHQLCVGKSGLDACPAGYPSRHETGTGVTDTRACSACTCGSTASCGEATVTFFSSTNCQGSSASVRAEDRCREISASDQDARSWRYDAPVQNAMGCAKVVDSVPTGAISLNGAEAICCR